MKRSMSAVGQMLSLLTQMAPRKLWLGGAALAALTVLMGMALLGLSGWFITATALAGLVPATALMFDVFMPSAGIRLLAIGRTGARYAERLVTHDATLAVLAALRQKLFLSWSKPQAARLLLSRPARLLQRLTSDVDALDNLYLRLLVPAVSALGAALFLAIAYGFMRWWLGALALLWLLLTGWGIALWHGLRSRKVAVRRAMALEHMRMQTVDLVAGQVDLLMAGRLPDQVRRVVHSDLRGAQADELLYRSEAVATQAYGVVAAITLSIAVLLMAWLMEQHYINAPVAALGILLALTALEPFAALRRGAEQAGRTWLAVRRLAPGLSNPVEAQPPLAEPLQREFAVRVQAAQWHRVGPISLNVGKAEKVALIGCSGAGKSTLLHWIAGELQPQTGVVAACRSSWMTQRTELFQDTLRDNLKLADAGADDDLLWSVLELAGLRADVMAMPQRLDTMLGEGGMGLSGGQSRRLALARLLLSSDRCWLLDEVSEGLDAGTAADVLLRLKQFAEAKGKAVIFATHWQREARMADRIVSLEAGQVTAQAQRDTPEFERLIARLRPDRVEGHVPPARHFSD